MADELTIYAQELLIEASRANGGLIVRGYENEPPDPDRPLSAVSQAGSLRQRALNASDNRRRTGSSSSDARLGLHTNGRFFPLLEEVWNEGFMELVIGKFIEPLDNAMEFKVSPKGYQTAKQLVASPANED